MKKLYIRAIGATILLISGITLIAFPLYIYPEERREILESYCDYYGRTLVHSNIQRSGSIKNQSYCTDGEKVYPIFTRQYG